MTQLSERELFCVRQRGDGRSIPVLVSYPCLKGSMSCVFSLRAVCHKWLQNQFPERHDGKSKPWVGRAVPHPVQNGIAVPLQGEGSRSCPQRLLTALSLWLLPDSSSSISPRSAGSLGEPGEKEEVLMGHAWCSAMGTAVIGPQAASSAPVGLRNRRSRCDVIWRKGLKEAQKKGERVSHSADEGLHRTWP